MFVFHFHYYSCFVSLAAALSIAVPCDLPPWLAANRPQVQPVCQSCRSQSITEVNVSRRNLGDEEVKAPTGFYMHGFPGGRAQRGSSVTDNVPCASQLYAHIVQSS